MSTSVSGPPAEKKISSWVRPGVREVRASALRAVSALIRLDLPTLERPAKAISTPFLGASDEAAATNCQSPLNSLSGARSLMRDDNQEADDEPLFLENRSLRLSHSSI